MYRLLIFIVFLTFTDAKSRCRGQHCKDQRHHSRNTRTEETFHKLAHHAIAMERKFEKHCRYNTNIHVMEVYDTDLYALKYSIPEFKATDIVVKVIHKTMYVSAERWDPTGLKNIMDVKILPDNLSPEEATWTLKEGELQITFPYKTPLGTVIRKTCGNINFSVIIVPVWVDKHEGSSAKKTNAGTKISMGAIIRNSTITK